MSVLSDHVVFARLVDLVEDRVAPDEHEDMHVHLAACAQCAAEFAWLERVIDLMRTDLSEDPPASLVADVIHMFERRTVVDQTYLRRVIAVLEFDSANLSSPRGRRSGLPVERQLLFRAEELGLDLRIAPHGPLWMVSGQLLGTHQSGQVELHGPSETVEALLNDQCEFTLPPIPGGNYQLTVRLADLEIEIGEFEIGA